MRYAAADANIPHADIYADAWAAADDEAYANAYDADAHARDADNTEEEEEHEGSQ